MVPRGLGGSERSWEFRGVQRFQRVQGIAKVKGVTKVRMDPGGTEGSEFPWSSMEFKSPRGFSGPRCLFGVQGGGQGVAKVKVLPKTGLR